MNLSPRGDHALLPVGGEQGAMTTVDAKLDAARASLSERVGVVVAFSGGVDSAVVAALAQDALGDDHGNAENAKQNGNGNQANANANNDNKGNGNADKANNGQQNDKADKKGNNGHGHGHADDDEEDDEDEEDEEDEEEEETETDA